MVPVQRLTENILEKRFSILPPTLQEAIASDENLSRVTQICNKNGITDAERILIIQQVVSFVLLGFLHIDDVSDEISDASGFEDPQVVGAIVKDLNTEIFSPLNADLKGNYKPFTLASAIKKDAAQPIAVPKPIPTIPSIVPRPKDASGTLSSLKDLSQAGWSKLPPNTPIIISTTSPLPTKNIISTSVPTPKPPTPSKGPVGEFERLKPSMSAVPKAAAVPAPAPAPVMLQQETPTSAAQKNADFHIVKSNEGAQIEFSKMKEQVKVMPAVIEFNKNIEASAKSPAVPVPPPATRYGEFRSSLASIPVADAGTRKITEITAAVVPPVAVPIPKAASIPTPVPKPPISPTLPMPPKPPIINNAQAASPTTPKVIVQDFLEQPPK